MFCTRLFVGFTAEPSRRIGLTQRLPDELWGAGDGGRAEKTDGSRAISHGSAAQHLDLRQVLWPALEAALGRHATAALRNLIATSHQDRHH